MTRALPYPVYDADNHLYETEDAMTAHLPRGWRKEFCYVDVDGRKKLAIGGVISDHVPNPTFEVLAAPGTHETWSRAKNAEGLTLRELTGKPIPCPPAYRSGADRLARMDAQGLHAALLFPTLASAVEERMSYDHALMNAVLHSLNEWLHEGGVHRPMKTCVAVLDRAISDTMAALVCHGVFDRFPGVRVACVENGSRRVRSLFERFELAFGQQPMAFARHPIETFRRHVWVSAFCEEPIDELARLIGADHVLFGSDYPHPEGLAEPTAFLDELAGFGPEDQQRIMSQNLKALLAAPE